MHKYTLTLLAILASTALQAQDKPKTETNNLTAMPEVIVTGQAPSYTASDAVTASKLDVPLKDLPVSVQVVPKEVIADRGATKVEQVAETVSGVRAESSYGNNGAMFFNIRGFTASDSLRDGFRNYGYLSSRDVQNIDRIEVLKGPGSALYGSASSLGGYINTLSKRPQNDAFTELGITAGSFGLLRPTIDWNQPLNADGSLAGRLNAAWERNDTFRDNGGYRSFCIAPALKWDVDADTSLTLLLEYDRRERDGFDFGVPNLPNYKQFSRTRYFGLDDSYGGLADYGTNDTYAATFIMEHKLNGNWTWREAAHYSYGLQRSNQSFPNNFLYTGGDLLAYSSYAGANEHAYDAALQSELLGKFDTGSLTHHVVIGAELSRLDHGSEGSTIRDYMFDLFDARSHPLLSASVPFPSSQVRTDNLGIYLQDLIDLTPSVKLLAGLRADWFSTKTWSAGALGSPTSEFDWSPRAGLVWQPAQDTSLYFGYNKAFAAVVGHNFSGQSFKAEGGEQYEVGVKQDMLGGKLSANLAAFELTRSGILTSDPTNPLNQVQTGEQRSRGIEFDLAGELTPAWKLIFNYAFTDAEVTEDNAFPIGDALSNVPKHSGSLWTKYQFQDGALKGFGIGAGLTYVGEREANLPNTYKLDAYWRTDAALYYDHGNWRTQVNFLNVFNDHYYRGGSTGTFNYTLDPGAPFAVQASVTYKF